MAKPRICVKGINCGNSCITKTKICRIVLSQKTVKAAEDLSQKVKAAKREKPYEARTFRQESINRDEIRIKLLNGNSTAKIEVEPSSWAPGTREIGFTVNDSFDRADDTENRIAIAKAVRRELLDYISKQPEGSIFISGTNLSDDAANTRVKAYKRAGFSELINEAQYAIIKDGKLQPYTGDLVNRD